jgi:hypothetical protein
MKLLLVAVFLSGCLFDPGTTTIGKGPVDGATLCGAAAGGCPPCSSRDGAVCRDTWYSSAMRCTTDAQCGASNACQRGYCVLTDADGDGIDDDFEREVAQLNLPAVFLAADESCGGPHGVLYRVRRHPQNPSRLAITYVVLYSSDCGPLNGHAGDAETFAVTVDLDAEPGAPATVGVETWAHAHTSCGSTSSCDAAPGTSSCADPSEPKASGAVVIYASTKKHANYLSRQTCSDNCLDQCSPGQRLLGPLLNVGEPDHPLVHDLTTDGFVQTADGWDERLLHIDPWGTAEFGGGGRLDEPLTNVAPPGQPLTSVAPPGQPLTSVAPAGQ